VTFQWNIEIWSHKTGGRLLQVQLMWVFFLKKTILIPNVAEKNKYSDLGGGKKII
jgi:hypothetical protein